MTKIPPSKEELERRKLTLEIGELERQWWQRPVYLSILLPMVLAALTVLAGILSGYFDRERTELKRNVEALNREKSALLETQNVIRQANANAEKDLKEITERVDRLRDQQMERWMSGPLSNTELHVLDVLEGLTSPTPKPKQDK